MATTTPSNYSEHADRGDNRRVWTFTETKGGPKTTEFIFMVLFIVGVLVATYIDDGDTLHAEDGWLYAAIAAAAYFVSRGLAKSGTREPYTTDND